MEQILRGKHLQFTKTQKNDSEDLIIETDPWRQTLKNHTRKNDKEDLIFGTDP